MGRPAAKKEQIPHGAWKNHTNISSSILWKKSSAPRRSQEECLLLLHNHCAHLSIRKLNSAKDNGITMLSFPPRCSHRLQLLDRSVCGPLKKHVFSASDCWVRNQENHNYTWHPWNWGNDFSSGCKPTGYLVWLSDAMGSTLQQGCVHWPRYPRPRHQPGPSRIQQTSHYHCSPLYSCHLHQNINSRGYET